VPVAPFISPEYRHDGDAAVHFIADTKPFWEEASVVFCNVWPTIHNDFTKYDLSPDTPHMAGSWCGCAVNVGALDNPVQTEVHRDVGESPFGISCLTAFGEYGGGGVILWEAQLIVDS